jgi:hypothetical protein
VSTAAVDVSEMRASGDQSHLRSTEVDEPDSDHDFVPRLRVTQECSVTAGPNLSRYRRFNGLT